jgi:hypothetical protein
MLFQTEENSCKDNIHGNHLIANKILKPGQIQSIRSESQLKRRWNELSTGTEPQ